jgi:WD40 repeat protein
LCALSDGRRVISGSRDNTLRVWDIDLGECERKLTGHVGVSYALNYAHPSYFFFSQSINCVCASSDRYRVISGSDDSTLRVWDVDTGECEQVLKGHSEVSQFVLFYRLDIYLF